MAGFRACFESCILIQTIVKGLQKFVVDIELSVTTDGIRYVGQDQSKAMIAHVVLKGDIFREFSFHSHGSKELRFSVPSTYLAAALRAMPGGANVTFELTDATNPLEIRVEDEAGKYTAILQKLHVDESVFPILPEESFVTTIEMPPKLMTVAIRDVSCLDGKTLKMSTETDSTREARKLTLESVPTVQGTVNCVFFAGEREVSNWSGPDITQHFDLKYLSDCIAPFSSLSPKFSLSFGDGEAPLRIRFDIDADSYVEFFLHQKRHLSNEDVEMGG